MEANATKCWYTLMDLWMFITISFGMLEIFCNKMSWRNYFKKN